MKGQGRGKVIEDEKFRKNPTLYDVCIRTVRLILIVNFYINTQLVWIETHHEVLSRYTSWQNWLSFRNPSPS
jgi:hypothetical protein